MIHSNKKHYRSTFCTWQFVVLLTDNIIAPFKRRLVWGICTFRAFSGRICYWHKNPEFCRKHNAYAPTCGRRFDKCVSWEQKVYSTHAHLICVAYGQEMQLKQQQKQQKQQQKVGPSRQYWKAGTFSWKMRYILSQLDEQMWRKLLLEVVKKQNKTKKRVLGEGEWCPHLVPPPQNFSRTIYFQPNVTHIHQFQHTILCDGLIFRSKAILLLADTSLSIDSTPFIKNFT